MRSESEILCEENILRKLTDFVLLNSCSISSSGLYNGKAGMALTLFEISRCLKDEYIEERASELLQESLLSKNEDIGFENGLSGIGFAMLYLVKNKFINADFQELFGDKLFKILNILKDWNDKHLSALLFDNVKIVYFLDEVWQNVKDVAVIPYVELFSSTVESILIKQFEEENDVNLSNKKCKIDVLESFEGYLKIASNCKSFKLSRSLPIIYSHLYLKNRYVSHFSIGHYLHLIARETGRDELEMVARINTEYAVKDIHPETILLTQRLSLLYLFFTFYQDKHSESIRLLEEGLFDIKENSVKEKELLFNIQPRSSIAGYQSGVSRLLLYWAYRRNMEQQADCTRFKKIF